MGAHAKLLAEAGAVLSAIDLTPRAVAQTSRRLSLAGLKAEIKVMDAEAMEFPDGEFDFVWSWGVIHHSSRPEKAAQEVCRVLKPGGEFRLMVYHRRSLAVAYSLIRATLSGKVFKGWPVDEILNHYADGYVAKHYTGKELVEMLVSRGFSGAGVSVLGQKAEVLPIPAVGVIRMIKPALLRIFPDNLAELLLSRFGGMLFGIAKK